MNKNEIQRMMLTIEELVKKIYKMKDEISQMKSDIDYIQNVAFHIRTEGYKPVKRKI